MASDLLDAIDGDVLQLLSRRMSVVAEVAAYKRANGVHIRDIQREREILRDRCEAAEQLGLPPAVIENVWRQLMLASRDHQAALRVEMPASVAPKTIAIIGGRGGMGRALERLFGELGHTILVSDVGTELSAEEAAKAADVVIISVPIDVTCEVIRRVGPFVREDALLMDVTSIKGRPLQTMLESTQASVVGTHPMFGPGVHTFQGQRVVVCEGRGEGWHRWVNEMLHARGIVVTHAEPTQHDKAMAVVQVLNHFQTQVLGLALSRMGVSLEETLAFTSPAYLLEMYVAARHFAQAPELYGPIEMLNPETPKVTAGFLEAAREMAEILESQDQGRFDAVFGEVRAFFGSFTDEALEQSRFLIDRLIELSAGRSARSE